MSNITLSKLYPKNIANKPLDINTLVMTTYREPTSSFTIEKLVMRRNQEKLKLQAVYENIYTQCLQNIESADNMKRDNTTFEIPLMIYNSNNYDQKECTKYINDKLVQAGLETIVLYDTKIYISWFKIEDKYTN